MEHAEFKPDARYHLGGIDAELSKERGHLGKCPNTLLPFRHVLSRLPHGCQAPGWAEATLRHQSVTLSSPRLSQNHKRPASLLCLD